MDEHRPLPTQQFDSDMPVSKQRIFDSFKEVQEGDYLAVHQAQYMYVHHYLVESISADCSSCVVIESWRKKIQRKTLNASIFQESESTSCYKLNYDPGVCILDTKSVIADATSLLGQRLWKSQYLRKKFVHFMKTGREPDTEINLTDIPNACLLVFDKKEQPGKPTSVVPLNKSQAFSESLLKKGDHIISNCHNSCEYASVYRSHLVVNIDAANNTIKTMTLKGSVDTKVGIVEEEVNFQEMINPHKVEYSSSLSPMMAIEHAKERFSKQSDDSKETFHSWNNNSHLFVSWCKTGEEDSLTDILKTLRDKEEDDICYPVLFKVPVESIDDITKGDHLVCKSRHYLVQNVQHDTFDAYTLYDNRCVLKTGMKIPKGTYKVDYGEFKETRSSEQALELAQSTPPHSCKSWKCSSQFVTEMKCTIALSIDERCLIDHDVSLTGCTSISSNRLIDVGDHLVIKPDGSTEFHSALVYKRIDEYKFLIMPPLPNSDSDEVDFSPTVFAGEAYRIDYSQNLPQNEVLKHARCKSGMSKQQGSSWDYVTWAKVGKSLPVPDISTIPRNDHGVFIEVNSNVHQYYEKISSFSEIQKGDHIFINCGLKRPRVTVYRKHMLVTECTKDSTVFKVAFCLRTYVQETDIDLKDCDVYHIKYVDELSTEDAVKRVQEIVGKRYYGPFARLWFVPWCKANYDSVEVSLLPDRNKPKSKSRISSFTQLNPGDYLVRQCKWFNHHYLVLSVESPNDCTVYESRWRKIHKTNLRLTDESQIYYRINYEANVCFKHERSIEHAKALLGSWDLRILTSTSRQKFIHHLKTGEDAVVNVAELPDNHFMSLELECIVSPLQLKRGDHVCQRIGNKALGFAEVNHHMLVDDPNPGDNQRIKVLHFQVSRRRRKKGTIVNEEVDVAERGVLYRIPYPDRNDPREGIDYLRRRVGTKQKYNLLSNNCEHLMTGVITGVAFSTQVEKAISKLIKFSRSSLKSHVSKLASHGSRDVAIHSGTHQATKFAAKIVIKSSMIKSAAITGGITLAVSFLMDYPLLLWHIYKLYRQRKFNTISEVEMKREVTKVVVECGVIAVFSLTGVVVGQLLIPIPLVGGLIGGLVGIVIGHILGRFVGWLVSKIFREKRPPSLPMTIHKRMVRSPW